MKSLPIFIFFDEDHRSPFLGSLLARLTPRFKQIGYHQFYEEAAVNKSLDEVIEESEILIHIRDAGKILLPQCKQEILEFISNNQTGSYQETYDLMRKHFLAILEEMVNKVKKNEGPDIRDTYCRAFYLINLLAHLESSAKNFGMLIMIGELTEKVLNALTVDLLTYGPSLEAYLRHLHAIKNNQIEFKGILDVGADHAASQGQTFSGAIESTDQYLELAHNIDALDKQFANAYLQADQPVYGRNGLAHVEGFQRIFSEKFPNEYAKANFNFVYVYHKPLEECVEVVMKFRQDLQNGTASLPLGIILINGMNKTEDEIVEEVWARIQGKVSEYQSLPDHLKRFRDDSVAVHVTDLLGSSYRLFGQAVNTAYEAGVGLVKRAGISL